MISWLAVGVVLYLVLIVLKRVVGFALDWRCSETPIHDDMADAAAEQIGAINSKPRHRSRSGPTTLGRLTREVQVDRVYPSEGYVLVVLTREAPPKVSLIEEVPESMIQIGELTLNDAGLGDWIGFYDWLRNSSNTVIGVRLWLDEESTHTASIAECSDAFVERSGMELSIFFGADREFESSVSDDQDFGGNRLFVGSGMYAFTFNAPLAR